MKKLISKIMATLTVFSAVLLFAVPAMAVSTTVHVYPGNEQGWGFLQETSTGSGTFVSGPTTPPEGEGSAQLTVNDTGGVIIGKSTLGGTRLDDITELEYSTYRVSGAEALAISLQFNVDQNVTVPNDANSDTFEDFQGRLVYEPYYTHQVLTGEWQTWNPMDNAVGGNWWFTNSTLATTSGCSISNPCTWSEVLVAYPNIGVNSRLPAVVFKAGGNWTGGFVGNVDAFTIGVNDDVTTINFELVAPTPTPTPTAAPNQPTNKDQCKNGGWKNFTNPTFKNQGDCVSSVASEGRSGGNP